MDGRVDGDRVVPAAQVLHERVPGRDRAQGSDRLQSAHRSQPSLESAVISFHAVVTRYERRWRRRFRRQVTSGE